MHWASGISETAEELPNQLYSREFKTEKMSEKSTKIETKTPMDAAAKARIMSAEGKKSGGYYEKGGWPARGQSAADKNENSGRVNSKK